MTVASKVKQAFASLKTAQSQIEQYSWYHPDEQAKEHFQTSKHDLQSIIEDMEQRIKEIEFEEPQFKGF
ncbi:DUF1657 domain-containing protein [Bacillus horti]|uniref:Phenylalanyl-tRNA synthetase alpha subunit n=1 Tax=Caldalkalibacillus horti TaxID=77523 RepID=A0ABT9VY58_9BACI|nr:DUF1657 domain-containing protein [Bacillus horti]MDQ0165555.1 phenylalanyl-tRNA synthetase alpha subunit [Bacillus horti]